MSRHNDALRAVEPARVSAPLAEIHKPSARINRTTHCNRGTRPGERPGFSAEGSLRCAVENVRRCTSQRV
jgi:hypothetical protein